MPKRRKHLGYDTSLGNKNRTLIALVTLITVALSACATNDSFDPAGGNDLEILLQVDGSVATALDGSEVTGTIEFVVPAKPNAVSASFYLDDPKMQGEPFDVDDAAPYVGRLDTTDLEVGEHTLTVAVDMRGGAPTRIKSVSFTVIGDEQDPGEPSDPTDPEDPTDPGDPTDPADPADPVEPEDPTEPSDPSDPDLPANPGEDAPAPTYWVSRDGSDSNDGRTSSTAFRTISKAASVVGPGDVVYIRGGTYREYTSGWRRSGEEGRPITFMAAPGETVVLDGSDRENGGTNPSAPQLIFVRDLDWYVFRDLTLRNAGGRGMDLWGNHHVVKNVITHGNHGDGIHIKGSYNLVEDVTSFDNYSYTNGGDSADGLKIDSGTGNVIRRVVAYENSDDGFDLWNSTNTLLEYSYAFRNGRGTTGNGMGFKLACGSQDDAGHVIRFNVGFSNRGYNFTDNGGGGLTMYNNTSFDSGSWGFVARARSGQARHELYNNISFNDGKPALIDDQHGGTRAREANNSWNLGISNPKFVSLDPQSDSFLNLAAGSPAIDAGYDVGVDYLGDAPDLGAYEYGLASVLASAELR